MKDRIITEIAPLPKPATFKESAKAILRVAAYARVSTDHEDQQSSLAAQTEYYEKKISEHPGWQFVSVYVDDGISGLRTERREGFNRMIEDCLAGAIDLVLTKSISRFARNTVDSVSTMGGVGTLITGYSWVSDYPMGGRGKMLGAYSDDFIPEYRQLTDMVHSHNCNILQQLVHIGSATAHKDVDIISASAVPGPYNEQMPREMTKEDIERVTGAFADAAVRAKKAGFDGVEIHAAHKFLLSQFLSPAYNHRTDAYGASDENRARFVAEVCMRIRESVGAEYPVFFKVNCDDGVENGITLDGMLTACRMLEEAGASAIEISGAWMNYKQDDPYFLEHTIKAAESVHIPVVLVGGVRGKEEIEKILSETPISYVAMARPFIANADYMKNWG